MDLPTAWNLDDKSSSLSIDSSGLRVNYKGLGEIDEGKNKIIGIGFCEKTVNLNKMPGLDNGSWGYHGDDGYSFCSGDYNHYGPLFSTGDTIGCCLNFKNNTVFFTKNGINLGIAFRNLKGILYPCVGLRSQGGSIEVNFGSRKFKFAATTSNDMDAIIDLTKLLDIEPNSKFALRYRGEAYYLMEKYKESFNDVNKLLKIEGNEEWASKHFAKIIEK
ncbi:SPRY-domain-containing protein [Gigaspora margarita]|uniref:SPRY-domain-containing protein n=1 Tax=Gigaspora margarita TaxID=4874 RepID=A0A8H4EMH7_GIGMA|nr:SPRY-domain-containing protein [Gigaspora margarita]